jgi:glycosyltransferase involved in cell wall biosynthesis
MNCFNGEKYVAEALSSIAAQTFQDYEVIFVDNCSTDRSVEIAKSFGEKIKIIQTPFNMQICKARVFAREYLTGEFICVLDIDDLWMPTKLEKQVAVMRAHPEVGLVYSNTIYFDHLGHEAKAYDSVMPSGRIFNQLLANYFISLETIMLRNSALKEHNLFFSDRYNISSDLELFTKLSYYADAYYINEPLGKWRASTNFCWAIWMG